MANKYLCFCPLTLVKIHSKKTSQPTKQKNTKNTHKTKTLFSLTKIMIPGRLMSQRKSGQRSAEDAFT